MKKSICKVYKSKNGWRWRVTHPNGRITANCGQGYSRRCDALRMAGSILNPYAVVITLEEKS